MYEKFEEWLDHYLKKGFTDNVVAANFNIYEDAENSWSVEIVGTGSFDEEDEDWACDEITDLGTRENLFVMELEQGWEAVLESVVSCVKKYLVNGQYSDVLKRLVAVGVGFVDGNIEIVYSRGGIVDNGDEKESI